ncbi:MAG: sigma-54-dependent Fis family transcriptional regulator [Spirochaetes bacterium]|nr:sigma-54-dependent Fis family transcriptional regulator [Spirochaetota bacterium]
MAKKSIILVADDDNWSREFLRELLTREGYRVEEAVDGTDAIEKLGNRNFDLVITDLMMPGQDGISVLKVAKAQQYNPEVLLVTAYGTVESAIEALKLNAFDYFVKPLNAKRVLLTVNQALERRMLKNEIEMLRRQVTGKYSRQYIIAASNKMKGVMHLVDIVAGSDVSVLIEGESGTGKELIARAIHFGGPGAKKPFIAVNCGALPEALLESELFGHVKGAFTGAVRDKKGLFQEADEGTLLLDEIGEMSPAIQVKLLRVLQDGEVRRVGSNTCEKVKVRIIASTNRKLSVMIKEGKFREDLFYRLRVVPITVPPLRDRKEDIIPLLNHFFRKHTKELSKGPVGFSPEALAILLNHDWPGNIRELENLVEGAIALSSFDLIKSHEVEAILNPEQKHTDGMDTGSDNLNLEAALEEFEKRYLLRALQKNGWNQEQTSKALRIGRSSLWRKMGKYGIKKPGRISYDRYGTI